MAPPTDPQRGRDTLPETRMPLWVSDISFRVVGSPDRGGAAMIKTLVAIDPGGTTGMAVRAADDVPLTWVFLEHSAVIDFLWGYHDRLSCVVVEGFQSRAHISHDGLSTVELVGGIIHVCGLANVPVHRRTPQQRIPFLGEAKRILKERGERYVDHQVDALAHLLGWERYNSEPKG